MAHRAIHVTRSFRLIIEEALNSPEPLVLVPKELLEIEEIPLRESWSVWQLSKDGSMLQLESGP